MFATNVTGLINMTQAILPIFLKRADGGAGDIINIGSIAGREPYVEAESTVPQRLRLEALQSR